MNKLFIAALILTVLAMVIVLVSFFSGSSADAGICDDAIVGVPEELHADYLDRCWEQVTG